MSVVIETTIGDITVDLFLKERPMACMNFLKLCKLKYYNFNLFHNIEQGFIAQTGDPTGVGDGGSSVWGVVEGPAKRFFEAESLPKIKHSSPGLISLVSVGRHLVGSQFFFTLAPDLTSLDGVHCVFGEVVEGHDVLRKLNEAIVDDKFRPFQDIRITHTVILEDPYPDPRGFRVPSRSPSPSEGRMANGRIAADEDVDDASGKTAEEVQEMMEEREAKARATILEIVGDIPSADIAPPENVLFVCKLNPVTTDDDLEIIFSRFGKVKNCEVIRDRKTGDSLQYAFVEFADKAACEAAYFKMDNVLIDDRRIHVDFSQSVAKVKWRGKGRGVDGAEGPLDFNDLKFSGNNRKIRDYEDYKASRKYLQRMTSEKKQTAREDRHRPLDRKEEGRGLSYFSDKQKYRSVEKSYEDNRRNRCWSREYSPRRGSDREKSSSHRPSGRESRLWNRYKFEGNPREIRSMNRKCEYPESQRSEKSIAEKRSAYSGNSRYKKEAKRVRKSKPRSSSSDLSCDSPELDSSSSSESSSTTSSSTAVTSSSDNKYRKIKNTASKKKNRKYKKH